MNDGHSEQEPITQFEIGLVLAGTVSAGAYTAGVLDFLIEALDAWHEAKAADAGKPERSVPPHEVMIKVISGASGGAMNAAIAAIALHSDYCRYDESEPPENRTNWFHEAWVNRIDIDSLVTDHDLKDPEAPVRSLLDSTEIKNIVGKALSTSRTPRTSARSYVSPNLRLYMTVTNLRGVNYRFDLGAANPSFGHAMTQHADFMHFVVGQQDPTSTPPELMDARWLDLAPDKMEKTELAVKELAGNWDLFGKSALASAAFPLGFQARELKRPADDYLARRWRIPGEPEWVTLGDGTGRWCARDSFRRIEPDWTPAEKDTSEYVFLNVDGGTIDNHPLELARTALAGLGKRNPRDALGARRAVLMINPFPRRDPDGAAALGDDLLSVARRLKTMFVNQSRFKPDELALAQDETVYSRFLIGPRRRETQGDHAKRYRKYPVIGERCGAFAAFLDRKFREHDFQLGRYNCQQFLRRHFRLPETHPLFRGWDGLADPAVVKEQYYPFNPDDESEKSFDYFDKGEGIRFLPIIPLVGAAAEDLSLPDWPIEDSKEPLNRLDLERKIEQRLRAVADRLIERDIPFLNGWLQRSAVRWAWRLGLEGRVVRTIAKSIMDDLKKLDEFEPDPANSKEEPQQVERDVEILKAFE